MYCFNCLSDYDDPQATDCDSCGASLLVHDYRAVEFLNSDVTSPVLEVTDGDDIPKVMRLVRGPERIQLMEDIMMGLRLISQLSSRSFCPDIIDTFFWNFDDSEKSIKYVLLEKVEGPSLKDYVENHTVNDAQLIGWMTQLFEMIDAFHGQSWLLRDIKPENFVINSDGQLIFVDIASLLHWPWDEDSPFVHLSSPGYTAPEQNDRKPVTASDVFSIGRTAIFCMTGRSPVELYGENGFEWQHLPKKSSPLLLDFLEKLVALSPIERPSVKDSIVFLNALPGKIRKEVRWNQYKWPVTTALVCLALAAFIPLERRLSSWSNRIRADQKQLAGDIEQAELLYERSLRTNSGNALAYLGLGMTCSDVDCGVANLEKALELEPENDLIIYNLAALFEAQDPQRAIDLYGAIQSDSNRYALAQNNLARLEILRDNTEKAIVILNNLRRREHDDRISDEILAKTYKNEGLAYFLTGDYQSARESLDQSLVLDPLLGDSYCLLASMDPTQADLISCLSLESQSPETKQLRTRLFSQYLVTE